MDLGGNPLPRHRLWLRRLGDSPPAPIAARSWRGLVEIGSVIGTTVRAYLRFDVPVAIFAVVYLVLFVPLIPRNTDNPQLLAAYANDEPFLTMALEATLAPPYGNPGVYFDPQSPEYQHVPSHWADMRYANITYYGGALFDAALPVYAPLRAVGAPPFPTGPIVLRAITLLASLLSLVVLYNIGKTRGFRSAGLFAAIYLASDSYFLYYADFIHPDTLQMLFGLIAFLIAVRVASDADRPSVAALGLMCGVVHGTKAGGAWTIPMALVAIWLGTAAKRTSGTVAARLVLYAGSAVAGFFVTTPYAFFDSYYRRSLRIAYGIVTQDSLKLKHLSLWTWTDAIYHYIGFVGAALAALAVGRCVLLLVRRHLDAPLTLATVLALSQFLWYGGAGKLWLVPGYLLLSFGLIAVFAFETLFEVVRAGLRTLGPSRLGAQRAGRGAAVAVVALLLVAWRWFTPADWAVSQYTASHSTVRAANDWAIEHHIDPNAVIVFDDLAYFDRSRFPRAHLNGGVLTWQIARTWKPNYIVLSSSLYGADWMQNLIAKQHFGRSNPDPFNVRLYQDLLARSRPGPTDVAGIDLEAVVRPSEPRPVAGLAESGRRCQGNAFCDLGPVDLGTDVVQAESVASRARALANADGRWLVGPELRIFRVQDPARLFGSL